MAKKSTQQRKDDASAAAAARAAGDPVALETNGATYNVALPSNAFEGPLDLLLHLCQKHELDILDIPISFVTEKYLEYLSVMALGNLDVASEYLLMAATLAHIKSKMLLPVVPSGQEDDVFEEEEDPREALIRRLLEYQKYKAAANDLLSRGVAGNDVFPRGSTLEEAVHTGLAQLAEVPLFALVDAFQSVLARSKVKISHDIVADRISLADRIQEVSAVLTARGRVAFLDLFEGVRSKFDLVITFLALLEMTKLRMTRITQTEALAPIYVEATGEQVDIDTEVDDEDSAPVVAAAETEVEPTPEDVPEWAPHSTPEMEMETEMEASEQPPHEDPVTPEEPVSDDPPAERPEPPAKEPGQEAPPAEEPPPPRSEPGDAPKVEDPPPAGEPPAPVHTASSSEEASLSGDEPTR
jgi:segregation and condensation protein A